ncbi:hypothetical protein MRB53_025374 [Persea americana]|uniref:Uncharacterized protein n=1 Tax=Persea americana TaxID=3435 RepID=A0ACC2LG10_PERAE|nr:hypothetical protein MRB53_025374 [Persea americana]
MECKNAAFYLSCLNGFVSEQTRGRKQRPSSSSSSSSSAKMGVSERQLSVKKERSNQRSNVEDGFVSCSSSTSMSVVLELAFLGFSPEKDVNGMMKCSQKQIQKVKRVVPSSR